MKKVLLSLLIVLISLEVNGQATQTGSISQLLVNYDPNSSIPQRVIINLGAPVSGGFCSDKDKWEILLDSDAAMAQYSMLLASYMAGKQVKIWGHPYESCVSGHERVRNVEIK